MHVETVLKRDSELSLLYLLCKQPAVQLLPDSSNFDKQASISIFSWIFNFKETCLSKYWIFQIQYFDKQVSISISK